MKNLKKIIIVIFLISFNSIAHSNEKDSFIVFKDINDLKLYIDEGDYKDIIRSSLLDQPEFQYINSLSAEENFNLKYAQRNRLPIISGSIINDESLERNIKDLNSVRKRRDDSFDAVVEIKQSIYSGGSINAGVRAARSRAENRNTEKQKTISSLILDANTIYLNAATSSFILNYAENIFNILKPFKDRVDDRVKAGIMDPVDYALFSVRLNSLETRIYQLKSESEKNKDKYRVFFKKDFEKLAFPMFFINNNFSFADNKSYEVEISELEFQEKNEEIKSVRSEYLPELGISARYTKYDIDDDEDEDDIRGGLYISMPIFSFGRGIARINAAKAAAQGSKNYINISKKEDEISETGYLSNYYNATSNRVIYLRSYNDTLKQRKTIIDRLDISGFAINSLAEVILSEINQLEILLTNESTIIDMYLSILHQNQILNYEFKISLDS